MLIVCLWCSANVWGTPGKTIAASDDTVSVRRMDEARVKGHAVSQNVISDKPLQTIEP